MTNEQLAVMFTHYQSQLMEAICKAESDLLLDSNIEWREVHPVMGLKFAQLVIMDDFRCLADDLSESINILTGK